MPEKLTPRQVMDPEGTLPNVKLVATPKEIPEQDDVHHNINFEQQDIGHIIINQGSDTENWTEDVSLKPEWQAANREPSQTRGFGLATYLVAVEKTHAEGKAFNANPVLSEQGLKVWNRFIDAGVAEVIEPFELRHHDPDERGHEEPYYHGRATIKP